MLKRILWPLKSYQSKGQDIASLLAERKINVKGVFFSHMHDRPKNLHVNPEVPLFRSPGLAFAVKARYFSYLGLPKLFV